MPRPSPTSPPTSSCEREEGRPMGTNGRERGVLSHLRSVSTSQPDRALARTNETISPKKATVFNPLGYNGSDKDAEGQKIGRKWKWKVGSSSSKNGGLKVGGAVPRLLPPLECGANLRSQQYNAPGRKGPHLAKRTSPSYLVENTTTRQYVE